MKAPAYLALFALSSPAFAQEPGWDYSATFYGWLPALSAEVDTPIGPVEVEQSISDVLDQLRFAAFASIEARSGPWGIIGDFAYADLSATNPTPLGIVFGQARTDTKLTVMSGYAAYRVAETPTAAMDLAAGLRVYDVSLDLALSGGAAPPASAAFSQTWVDPLIGIRGSWVLSDQWRMAVSLDAGGFGIGGSSDLSWQAVAEAEYRFSDTWSAVVGYRHLSIDRPIGGSDVNIEVSGPIIGIRARF